MASQDVTPADSKVEGEKVKESKPKKGGRPKKEKPKEDVKTEDAKEEKAKKEKPKKEKKAKTENAKEEKAKTEDVKEEKAKKEKPKKEKKAKTEDAKEEKPKKEKAKKEAKPKKEKAKKEEKEAKPKKEKKEKPKKEKKEKPKKEEKAKKEKPKKEKKQEEDDKDAPDLLPSVSFDSDFFPAELVEAAMKYLKSKLEEKGFFEQPTIPTPGGPTKIPRLERLMGEEGQEYTYSRHTLKAVGWAPEIKALKDYLETKLSVKVKSNAVLINVYLGGEFHVSWHPDSEKELAPGEPIYSVSFGATRRFSLRQTKKKSRVFDYDLIDNSLFVMKHPTNSNFEHCLRKTAKPVGIRFNLTFRCFTDESRKAPV
jgi:alkylated DNA repair dioxygenase AlkB